MTRPSRILAISGWLLLAMACGEGPSDGLQVLATSDYPTQVPHLDGIVLHAGVAYVANASDGIAAISAKGPMKVHYAPGVEAGPAQCTVLALHAGSKTLYCASMFSLYPSGSPTPLIASFDVSDPKSPTVKSAAAAAHDPPLGGVRDLAVHGDFLLASLAVGGLYVMHIGADGGLGEPREAAPGIGVRRLAANEGHVVGLAPGRGLVLLDPEGGGYSLAGELALDGPLIGVDLAGDTAMVAMGSEGISVVDLDGVPRERVRIPAPGVATAADLKDDLLLAVTLSGVSLWDLGETSPRIRGYLPARWVNLDARFDEDGTAIVSDWKVIERLRIDPSGEVSRLEVQRGTWLRLGQPATFRVRNNGGLPLDYRPRSRGAALAPWARLGPGEVATITVTDEDRARSHNEADAARLEVKVQVKREGVAGSVGHEVELWWTDGPWRPKGRAPAVGEPMPSFWAQGEVAARRYPVEGTAQTVVFFQLGCPAMWPQLEDLAWRRARGRLEAPLVIVADSDPFYLGYADNWGEDLGDALVWAGAGDALPEVRVGNAELGARIYDESFANAWIPGGAAFPTDYRVSADGTILGVERTHRGAWNFLAE